MSEMKRRNLDPMMQAPRCGAKTRLGNSCQALATQGKARCRMHGGAKGSGAPKGNKNALKSGLHTADAIAWRKEINDLMRKGRAVIAKI